MSLQRFIQLALLGVALAIPALLISNVCTSNISFYGASLDYFPLTLVAAAMIIIHQESVQLPSVPALFVAAVLSAFVSTILFPARTHCGGQLTACKSNLKNTATSLEIYSTDNAGHYPKSSLNLLTPNYLKIIPQCPSAQKDTYSKSYTSDVEPDSYTIFCSGCHHHGSGIDVPNYPQYSSYSGVVLP